MTGAIPTGQAPSTADFVRRATTRLSFDLPTDLFADGYAVRPGDHVAEGLVAGETLTRAKAAAVLVPVVDHRSEATVLLTERVATLRAHSGQIAFPGGRIDPGDASPLAAALREAWEEVGLVAEQVTPLGYLPPYLIGTGYLVVPTVALVRPPLRLRLNPDEVAEAFEVPLAFLMDPRNHRRQSRDFGGTLRSFIAMPYAERNIWGATAGMLHSLHRQLYAS
ncbi:CoA pyrophosphatase [Lichenihabitans sp. Uapishka_5]|uniref:CoA pyrophosphatase n=1 Tax=Lichenihabitans sp. Uapishka_5 TaxID=3037302 RepID=UPI0029E8207B|nr:CoA pyrophosphatase [Lichenihabitans sp. Uapishka_5]MDX7950339.1 CoA pyrophosphatase [Lichenihabitans sp. Uapishka_5]